MLASSLHGATLPACLRCGSPRRFVTTVLDEAIGMFVVHSSDTQRRMLLCSGCMVDGWGRCGACGAWARSSGRITRPVMLLVAIGDEGAHHAALLRSPFLSCGERRCNLIVSAWAAGRFRSPVRFPGRIACYHRALEACSARDPEVALDLCAADTLTRILDHELTEARRRARAA